MPEKPEPRPERPAKARLLALGVGVFVAVLTLTLFTADDFGYTWDEGYTTDRIKSIHIWTQEAWAAWRGGDAARQDEWLSQRKIDAYWRFAQAGDDGHPPFYAILDYAGWQAWRAVTGTDGRSMMAYRFAPCLTFAATAAIAAMLVASVYGLVAGGAAAGAMVLVPRLFAHGQLANVDWAVVFMWTLTVALFAGSKRSRTAGIAFGVCLGLTAMTKLTGWFVVAPLLIWTLAYHVVPAVREAIQQKRLAEVLEPAVWLALAGAPLAYVGLSVLPPANPDVPSAVWLLGPAVVCLLRFLVHRLFPSDHWTRTRRPMVDAWLAAAALAPLAVWLATPNFWHDPVSGLARFLKSNLTREHVVPLPSYYLGKQYPFALPWHSPWVLTVATMPLGLLLLAVTGGAAVVRRARQHPLGILILLNALTLMVVRMSPSVPGHDVVRQFITSFVFIGMLAGIGASLLIGWAIRARRTGEGRWFHVAAPGATAALVLAGAVQLVCIHPYELAYYGEAVGSLPGARAIGLEATYYWDTMSPETVEWMNDRPEPTNFTFVRRWPTLSELYYWRVMKPHIRLAHLGPELTRYPDPRPPTWLPPPPDFYVLQMRRSHFSADDWRLVREVKPVHTLKRFGVTLLAVYRFADLSPRAQEDLMKDQKRKYRGIRLYRDKVAQTGRKEQVLRRLQAIPYD